MHESLTTTLLDDPVTLAALRAAFATGLFEALARGSPPPLPAPLLAALERGGALARGAGGWEVTPEMAAALEADAPGLAARAAFGALALADLADFGALLGDRARLAARARTFGFFRYERAMGTGAAQIADTEPWVAYVAALSRIETPALAPLIPVVAPGRLLEIGGNVGILAEALARAHPGLEATVLDLPAVCHLGRKRTDAVAFVAGDARATDWPEAETVLFKSMLHDWTEEAAAGMLARAAAHVSPGGRVIVCERGPIEAEPPPHGALAAANLIFGAFYRDPEFYERILAAEGLTPLPRLAVALDMTFHVVAAERSA